MFGLLKRLVGRMVYRTVHWNIRQTAELGVAENALLRQLEVHMDMIMLAAYTRFGRELEKEYDAENAKVLSAAVVNRLFARGSSPINGDIPNVRIDDLAKELLGREEDDDLVYGIVMSLRTSMVVETARDDKKSIGRVSETVQWMKGIISLPPDAPNPQMMRQLAETLQSRYSL